MYVVATVELVCKGPNNGVEHSELGSAVVKVLTHMGVDPGDVYAFSSDRASVLRKAYDDILKPVCPKAVWVSCLSHGLNNVAKSIIADVSQCFSMWMWSSASLRTDAFRLFLASNISSILFL